MNDIPSEIQGRIDIQHAFIKTTIVMFVSYFAIGTTWALMFFTENLWLIFIFVYFFYIAWKSTKRLKEIIAVRELLTLKQRYSYA
jgi:hypothetical protein